MIGLDTNTLLRYFTGDDVLQTARVRQFLAGPRSSGEKVFVSVVVVCELAWVLKTGYSKTPAEILDAMGHLLETDVFVVEDRDLLREAIPLARDGKADFPDYLLGQRNLWAGCRYTVSFDRALRHCDAFRVW